MIKMFPILMVAALACGCSTKTADPAPVTLTNDQVQAEVTRIQNEMNDADRGIKRLNSSQDLSCSIEDTTEFKERWTEGVILTAQEIKKIEDAPRYHINCYRDIHAK